MSTTKNSEHLQKLFQELCVISEDEKIFEGFIHYWILPNDKIKMYLEYYEKAIESDWFTIGSLSYCSFYLIFNPNGKNTDFSIVFNKKLPDSAWVLGDIYFDGIDVRKKFSVSGKEFGKKIELDIPCLNSKLKSFIQKKENDVNIHCFIKICTKEIKCAFDKEIVCYTKSRNYDSNKETFKEETFSDVSININGHLFNTHKALLARIPYFKKLFDSYESEQYFEITDINIEHEIFHNILTFLHLDDIPRLNFMLACKLYIIASDLEIFDLKNLCSSYLGANLTEINVIIILKLSHEYEDVALKKECFSFIKKHDIAVATLAEKSIVL